MSAEKTPSAESHNTAPHEDLGRAALLVLSPELLTELLQLPPGCHIDSAVAPHDQPGVLHLRVRGAGWPTKAGWLLPQVRGRVTRDSAADGSASRQVIIWDFPPTNAGNVIAADLKRALEPRQDSMVQSSSPAAAVGGSA